MDKTEGDVLAGIPAGSIEMNLTRSTIKMRHSQTWRVDKLNRSHDLLVCLNGSARYLLDNQEHKLERGHAMLIPAGSRFIGEHDSGIQYTGIAQHFTLSLFGHIDLINQMDLRATVKLTRWDFVEPLVRHYREIAPPSSITLSQHHLFMVILLSFLEDAFIGWKPDALKPIGGQDALSMCIVMTATQLTRNPLDDAALNKLLDEVPYNGDYFRRAFKAKLGYTPRKFNEYKKIEKAMKALAGGCSVKEAANLAGYIDVYFFSRMFKQYVGASPAHYKHHLQNGGDWQHSS